MSANDQARSVKTPSSRRRPRTRGGLRQKGVRALAILALVALSLGLPAAAPETRAATQTIVSLTFDDGPTTQYSARDTLRSHGMRATFYVNSGLIQDYTAWRMSWSQLHELAADGHEITGHTLTHADLPLLTPDQQRQEICDDRTNLLSRGYSPVLSFAYPYGGVNDSAKTVVAECGYSSGRIVGGIRSSLCPNCPYAETIPPRDPYATRTTPDIRDTTSLATMQSYVTQAENNGGGWVQLVIHHVCSGSDCDEYAISLDQLNAFLDWLQPRAANGTVVKTVGEVIGGTPPAADSTPPTTAIACNATTCSTGWYAAPVTVALSATDSGGSGVAATRYTTDGTDPTAEGTPYTAPFTVPTTSQVKFRSWDNAGNVEPVRSQLIRIDTTAPGVSITSPADGTTASRQGTIAITAAASDNSGVAKVAFYVDGALVGTSTSAPYSVSWKTNGARRGDHTLTAVATDVAGNSTTSAPVRVTLR